MNNCRNRRRFAFSIKIIMFAVLTYFSLASRLLAINEVPEDMLNYPVLIKKINNNYLGTGFYLFIKGSRFFVSARHVLLKEKNSKFIPKLNTITLVSYPLHQKRYISPIMTRLHLGKLYHDGRIAYSNSHDIVIIKIGQQVGLEDGLIKSDNFKGVKSDGAGRPYVAVSGDNDTKNFRDVSIGNSVFVFGYPSSIGDPRQQQFENDKPLLRKGVIAGTNEKFKTIILDCPVNYGNSGSPVFQIDLEISEKGPWQHYSLIGLVTQFVPFYDEWINPRIGYSNIQVENTGYAVVEPVDTIYELIEQIK